MSSVPSSSSFSSDEVIELGNIAANENSSVASNPNRISLSILEKISGFFVGQNDVAALKRHVTDLREELNEIPTNSYRPLPIQQQMANQQRADQLERQLTNAENQHDSVSTTVGRQNTLIAFTCLFIAAGSGLGLVLKSEKIAMAENFPSETLLVSSLILSFIFMIIYALHGKDF